jgi:PAS domain S-box-containing protein
MSMPLLALFAFAAFFSGATPLAAAHALPASASLLPEKRVLYIDSYNQGYIWSDGVLNGIFKKLKETGQGWDLSVEHLDTRRFPGKEHLELMARLIETKYKNAGFDLVLAADNPAVDFALRYRERIFPKTPIVFCGYNYFRPEALRGVNGVTGVNEEINLLDSIKMALLVHPKTRTLVFILSTQGDTNILVNEELESRALPALGKNYHIILLRDVSLSELRERLDKLDPDSLIFLNGRVRDQKLGLSIPSEEVGRLVSEASPAPVYVFIDVLLGSGVLGGRVIAAADQGRKAAELGLRILAGESPDAIPVVMETPVRDMFDYRAMRKFGVAESQLPPGATIINRPESLWSRYQGYILGALAFMLVQTGFIILLLRAMRQRRLALAELREERASLERKVAERTADLRYANEALAERESLFSGMFNEHSAIMLLVDPENGRILHANKAAMAYSGRSVEALQEMTIHQVNQSEKSVVDLAMQDTLEGRRNRFHFQHRLANGEIRDVEVHSSPIPWGKKTILFSIIHDVTERRKASEALKASEARLKLITDNMAEVLWVLDAEQRFTFISPSVLRLLGVRVEEALQETPREFLGDASWLRVREALRRIAANPDPTRVTRLELELRRKDGALVWVESSLGPLLGSQGECVGVLGVSRDITDRRLLERIKEDAERITRHDLKTPLTAIVNLPLLILGDDNLTTNQREWLRVVSEAGRRMQKTLNFSQDIFRMEQKRYKPALQPVELRGVIEIILSELRSYCDNKKVAATLITPWRDENRGFFVLGEEFLCYSMLSNLIKNALEAAPAQTLVSISLQEEAESRTIVIHNQGAVPEIIRDRFFEKYTTSGKTNGMGLGAYSAKLVVETLGGVIGMSTSSERGTRVQIDLLAATEF